MFGAISGRAPRGAILTWPWKAPFCRWSWSIPEWSGWQSALLPLPSQLMLCSGPRREDQLRQSFTFSIFLQGCIGFSIACALAACAASDPPATPETPLGLRFDEAPAAMGGTCLSGTSADYGATGPYTVTSREVTIGDLGTYTIFAPDPLDASCPHPIVAWGNGTGVRGASLYGQWHRHAASWGMVVIVAHDPNASSRPFLAGGIDYLLRENTRSSSPLFGKLSPRAGVAGHSQGGEAANMATQHPSVRAEVCIAGYGDPPRPGVAVLCETGENDFAQVACIQVASTAQGPAFVASFAGIDHGGIARHKDATRVATAWFRCFLADDAAACQLFRGGDQAPLCSQGSFVACEGRDVP